MKDIFTKREALQIAYHEMAHIIVKEHFGGEIDTITIDIDGIKVTFKNSADLPKCSMYQDICVATAGFVAENMYFSNIVDFENQSDTLFVTRLLENIGAFIDEIMRKAVSDIKDILIDNKDRLEGLANQLSDIIVDWDTNRYNGDAKKIILSYNKKDNTITKKG